MTYRKRIVAATAAVLVAIAPTSAAFARTPYILPNSFDVQGPRVTLIGATTEDDYFKPDGALAVPAYQMISPSGAHGEVKPAAMLKDMAVTEVALDAPGTYRFSTGQFVARSTTFVSVGGKWMLMRMPRPGGPPGEGGGAPRPPGPGGPPRPGGPGGDGPPNSIAQSDVPADAPSLKVDNVTVVETYVTKGAPTQAALAVTGQGFELKPATHPNAVYVDQGFAFQLLVDGKPAVDMPVSVYRAGNIYDDRRIASETKSDARGMAKVSFSQPGVYLVTTHTSNTARTPGGPPPPRNYTYSLTLEVTR